ncbi:hypothetical protein [Psychrobacillus lasiicapitis]|uniref:Uncharacterized protein n=1 Tax=Psychrobacillus lasiicapitis TaxID=1636719 RepID=A0A544T1U1_9BACI|nr:hypothetical protein [Psychrobacillus lasiicapitis]TQR11413.1 hypothetical protein FG382_15825 [Psychrobacillus lasiicapitis]GGA40753.1 hypothetical protein GCM10011384_33010 [Psychrobacillus lasiicapitis]
MTDEQKEKLDTIVDALEHKVPREVLVKAIEKIKSMNDEELRGLHFVMDLMNKHDIDINLYEETTNL